ncbi:hypothetical protein [Terasakiella pusilla]|uniref:hypothetical protein n=1 Tax=Terasakiella pusilla TaxID=64973 RepID=UPI003AA84382
MTFDVTLCTWRVSSELPLPEALPWQGNQDAPIDISIKLGPTPEHLIGSCGGSDIKEFNNKGDFLLKFDGVARYLIQNGTQVTVDPACDLERPDLRLLIQTKCLSVLAWQRGFIPFHGSVINIAGQTVALIGQSGIGKSSLAMSLVKRGHRLLSEETVVTYQNINDANRIYALPTLPNIRLWRDALQYLKLSPEGLRPDRLNHQKFHYNLSNRFDSQPRPLAAFLILNRNNAAGVSSRLLRGSEGAMHVASQILHPVFGGQIGYSKEVLRRCVEFSQQKRCFSLTSPKGVENIPDLTTAIEKIAQDLSISHPAP